MRIVNKDECCGCTACYAVCPVGAISMSADQKGFLYPDVDMEKCIGCKLCEDVCDFRAFIPAESKPEAYAVRHRNAEEVATSRSGAFFMALCDFVLSRNGTVFGCEMVDAYTVIHKSECTKLGVNRFKGSKYVQSDLQDTFAECLALLMQEKWVLFSGTGCQVHGLLSYLKAKKADKSRLITCDIVCHGTPSPQLWRDYITAREERSREKIATADFRDKAKFGWFAHKETYCMASGKQLHAQQWTNAFYSHVLFRESCYNCKYTTPHRYSDFTIADFWGIENNVPELDDDKGVSLVLIHSSKGQRVFSQMSEFLIFHKTELDNSLQPQLQHPVTKGNNYDTFWELYEHDRKKAVSKLFFPPFIKKLSVKVIRKLHNIWNGIRKS